MMLVQSRVRLVLVLATLGVASGWIARAQQPATGADDPNNFTGKSARMDNTGLSLSRRSFEASARANWHVHDSGQLLFAQKGGMRVQVEGQKMRELREGESVYLAARVAHWHGATPGAELHQVSVTFAPGIKWMEKVTDAQYTGTAPRK